MEFNRSIFGCVTTLGQDSECFKDADSAGAVVVRARCGKEREEVVCRVLVRAENRQRMRKVADLWFEARDDGGLGERVREVFERDVGAEWRVVDDL